jgi:AP-2 complex subunit alpha
MAAPAAGNAPTPTAWWTQTLQPEGILRPGPGLQLGFKMDFRPPNARMGVYFGNLGQAALNLTSCVVEMPAGGATALAVNCAPGPTALAPRGQALMMVQFELRSPFAGPPTLTIALAGGGSTAHTLPVLSHRFLQPWPLPSADAFFNRWRVAGLSEHQVSFQWAGPYNRAAASQLLSSGARLAVLENVDPVPTNLVASGYLATTSVAAPPDKVANPDAAIFCLVRLEVNPQRGAARLTARSRHKPLAEGLVKALAASWGNVAAPMP